MCLYHYVSKGNNHVASNYVPALYAFAFCKSHGCIDRKMHISFEELRMLPATYCVDLLVNHFPFTSCPTFPSDFAKRQIVRTMLFDRLYVEPWATNNLEHHK